MNSSMRRPSNYFIRNGSHANIDCAMTSMRAKSVTGKISPYPNVTCVMTEKYAAANGPSDVLPATVKCRDSPIVAYTDANMTISTAWYATCMNVAPKSILLITLGNIFCTDRLYLHFKFSDQ